MMRYKSPVYRQGLSMSSQLFLTKVEGHKTGLKISYPCKSVRQDGSYHIFNTREILEFGEMTFLHLSIKNQI